VLSWATSVNLERDCTGKLPTLLCEVSDHLLEILQALALLTVKEEGHSWLKSIVGEPEPDWVI
jgi:hypothetical protein